MLAVPVAIFGSGQSGRANRILRVMADLPLLEVRESVLEIGSELTAKPLGDGDLGTLATRLLDNLKDYSVSPGDFELAENDGLFGYQLTLRLFNGLGVVKVTAADLGFEFRSLASGVDLELAIDVRNRISEILRDRVLGPNRVDWRGHAGFANLGEADAFFAAMAPVGWSIGGRTAAFFGETSAEMPFTNAQLVTEKSLTVQNAAFCRLWATGFSEDLFARQDDLWTVISEAYRPLGLRLRLTSAK
jgi:hypothetical protein